MTEKIKTIDVGEVFMLHGYKYMFSWWDGKTTDEIFSLEMKNEKKNVRDKIIINIRQLSKKDKRQFI